MAKQPVIVNVYDMSSKNKYLEFIKIGAYHSGIEIFSSEYSYCGSPFDGSGIFKYHPKCAQIYGFYGFKYKKSITIGYTEYSEEYIHKLVETMGQEFKKSEYHLFKRNCNHFTNVFAKSLCGKGIPLWVNRLALISNYIPFLESCLPKKLLTPVIVNDKEIEV